MAQKSRQADTALTAALPTPAHKTPYHCSRALPFRIAAAAALRLTAAELVEAEVAVEASEEVELGPCKRAAAASYTLAWEDS